MNKWEVAAAKLSTVVEEYFTLVDCVTADLTM